MVSLCSLSFNRFFHSFGTQGNEIFGFYYTLAKNLKKSKKSKKEYLETLKRIKKLLEANKKLIQENSEYRRKFINLYQTYMPYLSDVRLEKKYQRLVRENNGLKM